MKVILEQTTRREVEVDVDAFLRAFDAEWEEFLNDDEESAEWRRDFLMESIYIMGMEDFTSGFDADSWITSSKEDTDLHVDIP